MPCRAARARQGLPERPLRMCGDESVRTVAGRPQQASGIGPSGIGRSGIGQAGSAASGIGPEGSWSAPAGCASVAVGGRHKRLWLPVQSGGSLLRAKEAQRMNGGRWP